MHQLTQNMNNLLSYFGLVDARISASEKDLPVTCSWYRESILYILPQPSEETFLKAPEGQSISSMTF